MLSGLALPFAAFGWTGVRLDRAQRTLDDVLPLDLVARAICDAYRALGELGDQAAGSLAIEPRASGYLRCYLPEGHRPRRASVSPGPWTGRWHRPRSRAT